MPINASVRSQRAHKSLTIAALPTAVAIGLSLLPSATAQSSIPNLSSNGDGSLSDAFAPSAPPERTPISTEYPQIDGLPEGVKVNRVEYLTNRHLRLYIQSAAMPGKEQIVQIQLARDWYSNPDKKFPEVWALDGLRARDDESGWTIETDILNQYADRNVNVIMPVGGESSFYSDWEKPDQGKHYMWETFLTRELVPILDNGYRSNHRRAVVGISMGGTAAMNLAERHPYLFDFVGSFSGYLDTTTQGMPQAIQAAQMDAGGYTSTNMWGPIGSQNWIDHDPKLGIENLKDMTVYVSSGSGKDDFGTDDSVAKGPANMAGVGLEVISRMSTQTFVDYAKRAGVEPLTRFRPSGVHSWEYWQFEMSQAWPDIANALEIPKEDRGAECKAIGAIAPVAADYQAFIGNCINNEYDAADGGKAQDFRAGTVYWSPDTDAHALWGRIGARYAEIGGPTSWLGYPTSSEKKTSDGKGRFAEFEHGNIYWHPTTGAFPVPKDMLNKWGELKWEAGTLGYPAGEVEKVGDGYQQQFQGGIITRNADKSNQVVFGAIGQKYTQMGGAKSELGFPVAGERKVKGGFMQEFERGYIYWSVESGAHYIMKGKIFDEWGKNGWEAGKLGFPTSDFTKIAAGGLTQEFQDGRISEIMGQIRVEDK